MTELRAWVDGRVPPPPEPLRRWMDAPLAAASDAAAEASVSARLAGAGLRELTLAREAPGRVRGSALHLLAADALLTYGSEGALEEADPEAALLEILRKAASAAR